MTHCLMGIDIGSYESKGVLTDISGKVLANAALKHELQFLKPGFVEQDVEKVWWGEFVELSKILIAQAQINAKDVVSIGLSGVYSMVPVDAHANPLRSGGIMYGVDTRSVVEISEVLDRHRAEMIFKRTGNSLSAQSMGPKILWLKKNEPEVFKRAHSFLPCANFIAARLTGGFLSIISRQDSSAPATSLRNSLGQRIYVRALLIRNFSKVVSIGSGTRSSLRPDSA